LNAFTIARELPNNCFLKFIVVIFAQGLLLLVMVLTIFQVVLVLLLDFNKSLL
jgi:hypothetical protein